MKEERFSIFQNNYDPKKHLKYLIIFMWLSFVFHLYILWGVSVVSNLLLSKQNPSVTQNKIMNVVLETKTESIQIPKEAAISDKNNISQSLEQDKTKPEEYNVANLNSAIAEGRDGKASYIPQESVESVNDSKQEVKKDISKGIVQQNQVDKQRQEAFEGGGETAPTLYDIKKKPVINLYNGGKTSFATHSKEYADYFINMQKKIEKYHREFFPIYQYYQGLLKDGEVIVEYGINRNGDIVNARVVSSYGSDTVDQASLNSIVYARNFGTLPKELQEEKEVTIRFHFIYLSR